MKAILHIKKIKTLGNVATLSQHLEREREVANADPARQELNERIIGSGCLRDDVKARLATVPPYRKDAVLLNGVIMSASPEWFRSASPERRAAWQADSIRWVQDLYGKDNVVAVYAHHDEANVHLHALAVPIDPRGRLNSKFYTGSAGRLANHQTSYARAVERHGLERGAIGTDAEYLDMRELYKRVQQPTPQAKEIGQALARGDQAGAIDQVETLARQLDETRRERDELRRERDELRRAYQEANRRLRDIDLGDVLRGLGAEQGRHERDQGANQRWKLDGHVYNINGHVWFDHSQGVGKRGAIDLVMHATRCGYTDAADYLRRRHGPDVAVAAIRDHTVQGATDYVQHLERQDFRLPDRADGEPWDRVRHYLLERRGLPAETIDRLHAAGDLYATQYQRFSNAVFVRRDADGTPTGAYKRGIIDGVDYKRLAQGTRRDAGYFGLTVPPTEQSRHRPPSLVLTESPIDAISYAALYPRRHGRIVSTDGSGALPFGLIEQALQSGYTIRCAFDGDEQGRRMWQQIAERYPEQVRGQVQTVQRDAPSGKDWNEQLVRNHAQGRSRTVPRGPGMPGPAMGR